MEKGAVAATEIEGSDDEWGRILEDDLAAMFAALKGSSSRHNSGFQQPDLMLNLEDFDDEANAGTDGDDGVSEEVEKVMQWAMDASCLDPSKKDKDNDDVDWINIDEEEEEEEEEDSNEKKRKEMNKGKPKKWFFF